MGPPAAKAKNSRSVPPLSSREDVHAKLKGLYGRPSIFNSYVDNIVDDADPGPGAYNPPLSSFGDQILSKKNNEYSVSIIGKNKSWERVFITKGHVAGTKGKDAPGVGCYSPRTACIRLDRGRSFGSSVRPDLSSQLGASKGGPGPSYDIRDKYHQGVSTKLMPNIPFGKADRFALAAGGKTKGAQINVGPGEYGPGKPAIDPTRQCKSFGIGWKAYDKLTRPGVEFEFLGTASPGPGPPLWFDPLKDGCQAFSFNKAKRFRESKSKKEANLGRGNIRYEVRPGPGQYKPEQVRQCIYMKSEKPFPVRRVKEGTKGYTPTGLPDKMELREAVSSDCRNPPTCKFGKPPIKARFNHKAYNRCTQRVWGLF